MREDFKYPIRTITRKEEIEGNIAVGTLFGYVLILPILIVYGIFWLANRIVKLFFTAEQTIIFWVSFIFFGICTFIISFLL